MMEFLFQSGEAAQLANSDAAVWVRWVLTGATVMLAFYVTYRSRTNKVLKEELDITREKAQRLEEEQKAAQEKNHRLEIELAEYKAKTDLTSMMQQHEGFQKEILLQFTNLSSGMTAITSTLSSMTQTLGAIEKRVNNGH